MRGRRKNRKQKGLIAMKIPARTCGISLQTQSRRGYRLQARDAIQNSSKSAEQCNVVSAF